MFTQSVVSEFAAALAGAASTGSLVVSAMTADGVPTLPAGTTGLVTLGTNAPAQVTIPSGYGFVVDTVPAAVTVTAGSASSVSLIAEFGGLTYVAGSGGGSVVGGSGDNVFFGPGTTSGSYTISYSSGTNTVFGAAASVVVTAGTGTNLIGLGSGGGLVVSGGSDTVASGTGAATVMTQAANAVSFGSPDHALLVNQASANTVVSGRGSDSMFGAQVASVGGSAYFLASFVSSETIMVESVVSDTLVAGIGSACVWGGAGNDDIYSAGGNLIFIAGSGSTSITGTANSNIVFYGDTSGNDFIAGAGNETIDTRGATGANSFIAGSGATDFSLNPLAAAAFYFLPALDGGSDTIEGVSSLDVINLVGTNLASSTLLAAGTMLTLADGTQILLQGYSSPADIKISNP